MRQQIRQQLLRALHQPGNRRQQLIVPQPTETITIAHTPSLSCVSPCPANGIHSHFLEQNASRLTRTSNRHTTRSLAPARRHFAEPHHAKRPHHKNYVYKNQQRINATPQINHQPPVQKIISHSLNSSPPNQRERLSDRAHALIAVNHAAREREHSIASYALRTLSPVALTPPQQRGRTTRSKRAVHPRHSPHPPGGCALRRRMVSGPRAPQQVQNLRAHAFRSLAPAWRARVEALDSGSLLLARAKFTKSPPDQRERLSDRAHALIAV